MPQVTKLSHAVLFVSNLERSRAFYEAALGLETITGRPGAVFLRFPGSESHHDLALMEVGAAFNPPQGSVGLYHLAWEVGTIEELADSVEALADLGALVGMSDHGPRSRFTATTRTASSSRCCGACRARPGASGSAPSQRVRWTSPQS
jgi:catechol-2,3-dioxygenase